MQAANRVAFNTFAMYAKVVITVGITLYSTRLILNELGASDYGVFNLVAGIVGMLAFFNAAVSVSIQRYMSYSLGMNDKERYFDVYKIAKKISLFLGVAAVVAIEILGFLFLDKLNIAPERFFAVQTVFHCIVASTFFSILAIPYEAAIIANEDIFLISIIYVAESFLKLSVAIYLIYSPFDKLIVYGIFIAIIYIMSNIYKKIYCRKYGKVPIRKKLDKRLFFEIAKFSGLTSFYPLSSIFFVQGTAIILNIFGGTVVNAAYGIANQINGQLIYFSQSLIDAMNPQIMKSEGGGDRERTVRLSLFSCKMSFFVLSFFSLPLIVEMPYVLGLWLKNVPEYTILFCRLILASALTSQLTYGLQSGIQAVGKIRNYQTALGVIKLLVLPVVYVFLRMGILVYIAVLSFVFIEAINFFVRLYFADKILKINIKDYFVSVFLKLVVSFIFIYLLLQSILYFFANESFLRLLMTIAVSSFAFFAMLILVILNKIEYLQIRNVIMKFLNWEKRTKQGIGKNSSSN
jgi:O-antigen/teichoic acid export membrane protein